MYARFARACLAAPAPRARTGSRASLLWRATPAPAGPDGIATCVAAPPTQMRIPSKSKSGGTYTDQPRLPRKCESHPATAEKATQMQFPSGTPPLPPRARTGSRPAWISRTGPDDFCSCVGFSDGIASCVGGFPTQRGFSSGRGRLPDGIATCVAAPPTQMRIPSDNGREIHAKAIPVRRGHAATDNVNGGLTQARSIGMRRYRAKLEPARRRRPRAHGQQ